HAERRRRAGSLALPNRRNRHSHALADQLDDVALGRGRRRQRRDVVSAMCMHMRFPAPRPEPDNPELEAFTRDIAAFTAAWCAFALHGLSIRDARHILQARAAELHALTKMRRDGL